jgi:glycosyltransferase 2 family protein
MVKNFRLESESDVDPQGRFVLASHFKRFGFVVGLVISLFLTWIVLQRIEWSAMEGLFGRLKISQIFFAIGFIITSQLLRVLRWHQIMDDDSAKARSLKPFFLALSIGGLVNSLSPLRVGELVRCFFLSSALKDVRAIYVLATVTLEKILDFGVLLVILPVIFYNVIPSGLYVSYGWQPFVWFMLVVGLLVVAFVWRNQVNAGLRKGLEHFSSPHLRQKILSLFSSFMSGIGLIAGWRKSVVLVGTTFIIWFVDAAVIWSLSSALSISMSPFSALVMTAIISVSFVLPSSPGFVGTYDFFSMAGLVIIGVEEQEAIALTLVMHSALLISIFVFGLVGLWMIPGKNGGLLSIRKTISLIAR